jgi:hypothetical protein
MISKKDQAKINKLMEAIWSGEGLKETSEEELEILEVKAAEGGL